MASNADKLIATARKYINHTERGPQRDNIGSGTGNDAFGYSSKGAEIVNRSNIAGGYGVSNTPWCNNFIIAIANECGYKTYQHKKNGGINTGYTGDVFNIAKSKGWLTSKPKPGSLGVKNGKHIFLVVTAPDKNGRIECIGGNESDSVRYSTRTLNEGWSWVTPTDLGTATGSVTQTAYCFQDVALQPTLLGPWSDKSARDKQYDKREAFNKEQNNGRWLRKVKINGKFAMEEGEKGTFNEQWDFGPWLDNKSGRDSTMQKREANTGRTMRPHSYKKNVTGGGSGPSSSGDVKYT